MRLFKQPAFKIRTTDNSTARLGVERDMITITKGAVVGEFPFEEYYYLQELVDGINQMDGMAASIYEGTFEERVENEPHVIPNYPTPQVQLKYLPVQGSLYVFSMQETQVNPLRGQFRVDYETGILSFNQQDQGAIAYATYTAARPAQLDDIETSRIEAAGNNHLRITGTDATVTYHRLPTTVAEVIENIPGIPLESIDGASKISAEWIEKALRTEMEQLQNKLRLQFTETVIKCNETPYMALKEPGINCDIIEAPYDGTDTNYLKLRREPLLSVQRIELVYMGNLVRSYPFEWVTMNEPRSELRIIPKTGSFNLLGIYSGSFIFHSFFPTSMKMYGNMLPWIQVDYTAGWRFRELPEDLKKAIEIKTCIKILDAADGLLYPGLTSKSMDGTSETTTRTAQNSLYANRKKELKEELDEKLRPWTRTRIAVI